MAQKTLNNFTTWNDLYFKNCYYSALFPIILHFNKSITPIILNDIYIYELDSEVTPNLIRVKQHNIVEEYSEILKERGINEELTEPSDLIAQIKSFIDEGRPVMLFIDCFYEPIRFDAFKQNHWTHILPLYGYDDDRRVFKILEHKYATGFTYGEFELDYDDAVLCNEGFIKNNTHGDFSGFFAFGGDTEKGRQPYTAEDEKADIKVFIGAIKNRKDEIFAGIDVLSVFVDKIGDIIGSLKNTPEIYGKLAENISRIKLAKSVERYRFLKVFGNDRQVMDLADRLLELWSFESCIAGKIMGSMNEDYIKEAIKRFKMIPELEREYTAALFEALGEWEAKNI
ncbi:MAG: cysteine peptidase family C39 domain-containing protein [Saccharofermentanales bacterium]